MWDTLVYESNPKFLNNKNEAERSYRGKALVAGGGKKEWLEGVGKGERVIKVVQS